MSRRQFCTIIWLCCSCFCCFLGASCLSKNFLTWLELMKERTLILCFLDLIWFDEEKDLDLLHLDGLEFLWKNFQVFVFVLGLYLCLLSFSSIFCFLYLIWWFCCLFINRSGAIYLKHLSSKGYFRKFNMKIT